jgi:hypothetical protein
MCASERMAALLGSGRRAMGAAVLLVAVVLLCMVSGRFASHGTYCLSDLFRFSIAQLRAQGRSVEFFRIFSFTSPVLCSSQTFSVTAIRLGNSSTPVFSFAMPCENGKES